jgi:hypothetical protein
MSQSEGKLFSRLPRSFQTLAQFWADWQERQKEQGKRDGRGRGKAVKPRRRG